MTCTLCTQESVQAESVKGVVESIRGTQAGKAVHEGLVTSDQA